MPKSKKTIPIYEYKEKVNGQTRYYIRPYIDGKQITKRLDDDGNMWLGREGYNRALEEIYRLEKKSKIINTKATFEELRTLYLEKVKKETKSSTYYNYLNLIENNIDPYFSKNKQIIKISKNDLLEWKQKLEKKEHSIAYLQKTYIVLKSLFAVGKDIGIEQNIVEFVDNFKKNDSKVITDEEKLKYISLEQFNQFISVVNDIMWKTFFIFLYYTGCRKGETLALTWNDIDFKNNIIEINKTLNAKIKGDYEITNTKNYQNRKIKMNKILINQLTLYKKYLIKEDKYNKDNFVFGNDKFLPLTTIDNNKNKYFKLAKIKPITIHEFRHSHVSLLINEYIKTGQTDTTKFFLMMSNRMGHTIQVMQKVYMHLFPTIQDEIVNLLNGLC